MRELVSGSPMLTRCRRAADRSPNHTALPANCCGLASSWHPFCSDPGAGLSIDGGAPRQDHIDAARAAARGVLNAWLAAQRVVPGRPAGLCAGCSRHDVSCFAAAQPKSRDRRSHARPGRSAHVRISQLCSGSTMELLVEALHTALIDGRN